MATSSPKPVCDIPCDDDCDADCHATHDVPAKREHQPEDCPGKRYHPIPDEPWPQSDGWVLAWWNEEYGQWCAGSVATDKDEALRRLGKFRNAGELQWRLVRETRIYRTEPD